MNSGRRSVVALHAGIPNGTNRNTGGKRLWRMARHVELTLVDLSLEVERDCHGNKIKVVVNSQLQGISSSRAPAFSKKVFQSSSIFRSLLSQEVIDDAFSNNTWLQKSVLQFLKLSDQYLALTSVLLKSKSFYLSLVPSLILRANNDDNDDDGGQPSRSLPLVELPRTEHGKPFIPPPCNHAKADAQAYFPMSISHQFPFAGMARLAVVGSDDNDESYYQSSRVQSQLVGLDIVVFENLNPRLYQSTLEFVNVFQDSFTEWEWQNCILHFETKSSDQLLKELYLRWSIKEAYTKAMGFGMSFEFSSFETRLGELDDSGQGLWPLVIRNQPDELHFIGTVKSIKSQENLLGDFEFFFKPLFSRGQQEGEMQVEPHGCACVCVGPLADSSGSVLLRTATTTSLNDLLRWHNLPEITE